MIRSGKRGTAASNSKLEKPLPRWLDDFTIAIHESGHAVIARKLGIAVNYVITLGENASRVSHTMAAYHALHADKESQLAAIANDICVALAGPHAQHRHRPQKVKFPHEWTTDRQNAENMSMWAALVESDDVRRLDDNAVIKSTVDQRAFIKAFFNRWSDRSQALVDEHWPAIETVAKALLVRPILNGDELDELISRRPIEPPPQGITRCQIGSIKR
jgi:hypothetical protein